MNGNLVSRIIKEDLKKEVARLNQDYGIKPGLAAVLVGNDRNSEVYVNNKIKVCGELGIDSELYRLPENTSQEEVLNVVSTLNKRRDIHGILVQIPLPQHINKYRVMNEIDPSKDVDGMGKDNRSKLDIGEDCFEPCTPKGIITLLNYHDILVEGKYVVIIGRSYIVGKPFAVMALNGDATVTVCHSKTKNLEDRTKEADILVSAAGDKYTNGYIVTDRMVKEGAIVIDVGLRRIYDPSIQENRLVGDVDFENVKNIAGFITPVPGGVGPMTVTSLMQNTVKAAQNYAYGRA